MPFVVSKSKKKKSGGGGFFHDLAHLPGSKIVSQTAKDLGNIAENAPAGVSALSKATFDDIVHPLPGTSGLAAIEHPIRGIQRTRQYQQICKPRSEERRVGKEC